MGGANVAKPPVEIQVVFQGGGAKLCLLMAVCSVLEADSRIRVTRVAGSSAGAVAAAMLASKKKIETYVSEVKRIAPAYLNQLKTHPILGAIRVAKGNPYFKKFSLDSFFLELFGNVRCKDLPIETQIFYTSLFSLEARRASADDPLALALAKSCNFPFAFVGYSSDNPDVDGGLALNLPVDRMIEDQSKGKVIGISFTNAFGNRGKNNLFLYAQQLFSAAIQSGVNRSAATLREENVFPIDTSIGTFEFDKALTDGFDTHFKLVQGQFRTWLDDWLEKYDRSTIKVAEPKEKLIHPILSNAPLSHAIVRDLDERLKAEPCTHAKMLSIYETAILDSAGAFTGKYITYNLMTCTIIRPTNVLQFNFQIGKGGTFSDIRFGCSATDSSGRSLSFTTNVQELTGATDSIRTFRVYFLFDTPLRPDSPHQPYILRYQYEGEDPYPKLGAEPEASVVTRWQGDAEEMVIAIALPRSKFNREPTVTDVTAASPEALRKSGLSLEAREVLVASEAIGIGEIYTLLTPTPAAENFYFCGRRVKKVKQGQAFGLLIEP